MALKYYKIRNLSSDTKSFVYNSGSSEPGTQYTISVQGLNNEVTVQSFYPPINTPIGTGEETFTNDNFYPSQPGYAWLWNDGNKVKYIKITHPSTNNFNISPFISDTSIISFAMIGAKDASNNFMYFPTASQHIEDYHLTNSTKKIGNYSFLIIEQTPSSRATSDLSSLQRNFNFEASGNYTWYATSSGHIDNPISSSGYTSSIAQGYFPKNIEDFGTTQFIRGWNNANYYIDGNLVPTSGILIDYLNNFNSGSTERDLDKFPYTASSLSWFINAPTSSISIASSSFGIYNGQNKSIKIGPSFQNTSSLSLYTEAIYGDDNFEYGGSGADDFISYYYKEDTNQILVYDPNNIENEPKNPQPLYYPNPKYNNILVGVGNPQTYITDEGHQILVKNGEQLSVFRGQQQEGTGDTNAWNYNRYLHRPYKIYLIAETGSNSNPSKIVNAHVSFSSSLASERNNDGRYTFETYSPTDLSLTASINLTASNALPFPPSDYGDAEYGEDEYGGVGSIPANQTWKTASLDLFIAGANQSIGTVLTSSTIYIDDINTDNSISLRTVLSSSYITPGTSLRLAVTVDPDGLNNSVNSSLIVSDYSMNIVGPTPTVSDIIPTYLDNILQIPEDCDPFVGNALTTPTNNLVMDVDYGDDILTPTNLDQILNKTAKKASIPDSHYSTFAIRNSRYTGSKVTSNRYNIFTEGFDEGTYGKTPTIDINKAYSGYFNRVYDTYPLLNQKSSFEIKYIIDENGNATNPRIGDYSYYNLEGSLSEGENVKIAITDKDSEVLYNLNSYKKIYKTGKKSIPILYSQVAARAYTSSIFVTGNVPLNDDPIEFKDYSFRAFDSVIASRAISFSPQTLQPNNIITGSGENVTNPYDNNTGITTLPTTDTSGSQGAGNGKPLSDDYTYRVNYTFETSYPGRTKTKNGSTFKKSQSTPDTGNWYMSLYKNETPSKFQLEALYADCIHLNPNTSTGIETKTFDAQQLYGSDIHIENNGTQLRIHFNFDRFNWAANQAGTNGGDVRHGGSFMKVRWRMKVKLRNSGGGIFSKSTPLRQGDNIRTEVQGAFIGSSNGGGAADQNSFFYNPNPELHPARADVSISLEGTKSLPSPAINANYWAFTGSTNTIIELLSENGNIAYGRTGFKQQYMEYGTSGSYIPQQEPTDPPFNGSFNVPSGSDKNPGWKDDYIKNPDFVGGKEPNFLQFPPVSTDWEVFTGDEIRFENDEDKVYKIIEVLPPTTQPLIGEEEIGRLKLVLSSPINNAVNLNFFLIRRYVKDEGNIIIDFPKPYGIPISPLSSTGLMFPEFPVEELSTNPDEVLKNLLEQKLIE